MARMSASLSARTWSNSELRRIAPRLRGAVVNVSGSDDRDKEGGHYRDYFSGASTYTVTNHVGRKGATGREGEVALDLTEPIPDHLINSFDVVFNHTTLEHLYEARGAFQRLCDLSRDIVIVVVPFAQVTHWSESYGDYWRFTPMGLRRMYEENSVDVVHEAAGPRRGEPIYLLFVGSKRAEAWRPVLPAGRIDAPIGTWIGSHLWPDHVRSLVGSVRRVVKRPRAPDPRTLRRTG
jgi:hypothetical protein